MPIRDRTGPLGRGPRTGRGLGPCNDSDSSETAYNEFGRGLGRGMGRGRGFGLRSNSRRFAQE